MSKIKSIFILIIVTIMLFLSPIIAKAYESDYVDTFTTENGIIATKSIPGNNGDIEIKLSNIELDSESSYTWYISKTTSVNDAGYSANLSDYSQSNKTALISLITSEKEIWTILRTTNTAYIFIKNNSTGNFIVSGLQIDLTLPALRAFKVTPTGKKGIAYVLTFNGEDIDYSSETMNNPTKATYDIETMYFKFIKITDETIISKYQEAIINGESLERLECFSNLGDAPDTGWITASKDGGYYNTKISGSDVPTEPGLYYLWLKGKNADTKTVVGYSILELDADGPIVESIKVNSPNSGTYKSNQTVKIRVNFNEIITGTTVPTLKIKFGESPVREITNGVISGKYIEYSYNIQEEDEGQLATVSLSGGTIKDASGNDAVLSCPIISGYSIIANKEGIINNNTENKDNNKEDEVKKDETVAPGILPNAGLNITIIAVIVLIISIGIIIYIKYNKLRDIK